MIEREVGASCCCFWMNKMSDSWIRVTKSLPLKTINTKLLSFHGRNETHTKTKLFQTVHFEFGYVFTWIEKTSNT